MVDDTDDDDDDDEVRSFRFPPSFRSNLTVNLGVLVFVIWKTKTPLSFRNYEN